MKKSNSFSLCADARLLVDQPDTFFSTTLECCVEIVYREANMMDARTSALDESCNRRIIVVRLEKLDESTVSIDPRDSRSVGVGEVFLLQSENFLVERKRLGNRFHRKPNVRNFYTLRGCPAH